MQKKESAEFPMSFTDEELISFKSHSIIVSFSFLQMLKHVQISPPRNRSDSISLRSSTSFSCASSLCDSPEPSTNDFDLKTSSRSSSYSSLNDSVPQVTHIFLLIFCRFNYAVIKKDLADGEEST
jgi:hypothetical protein